LLEAGDEERFYEFVVQLHRLNFLNLPVSDEKLLYRRYQARATGPGVVKKLMGFLFLRVPLVNPDAFLERTIQYARVIFSGWFFAVWLLVVAGAVVVGLQNADRFGEPLQGILAGRNLSLIWFTLIGLKLFHELGHAYACKQFGGYVPEMGLYFLVFTPCAYVGRDVGVGVHQAAGSPDRVPGGNVCGVLSRRAGGLRLGVHGPITAELAGAQRGAPGGSGDGAVSTSIR